MIIPFNFSSYSVTVRKQAHERFSTRPPSLLAPVAGSQEHPTAAKSFEKAAIYRPRALEIWFRQDGPRQSEQPRSLHPPRRFQRFDNQSSFSFIPDSASR